MTQWLGQLSVIALSMNDSATWWTLSHSAEREWLVPNGLEDRSSISRTSDDFSKISILWDVTSRWWLNAFCHFEGTCCIQHRPWTFESSRPTSQWRNVTSQKTWIFVKIWKYAHPTSMLYVASSSRKKYAEAWNWPRTSIYVTDWECVELYIHFSTRLYGVAFIEHEHQHRSKGPSLNYVCRPVRSVAARSCQSKDTRRYSLPSASAQGPWPPAPGRL